MSDNVIDIHTKRPHAGSAGDLAKRPARRSALLEALGLPLGLITLLFCSTAGYFLARDLASGAEPAAASFFGYLVAGLIFFFGLYLLGVATVFLPDEDDRL